MEMFSYVPPTVLDKRIDEDWRVLQSDLSRLNKLDTVVLCIKLNHFTANKRSDETLDWQTQALSLLFRDGILDKGTILRLMQYLSDTQQDRFNTLVFNRAGLLEMIRWVCIYSTAANRGNLKLLQHLRKSFIRALLTCADVYGKREIVPTLPEGISSEERQISFALGARRGGMFGGAGRDPLLTLGRTELLFVDNFLKTNSEYVTAFERIYKMSVDDWMACNTAMILTCFDVNNVAKDSPSIEAMYEWHPDRICTEVSKLKQSFKTYCENLGQSIEELTLGFGNVSLTGDQTFRFRHLRQKPILKLPDGRSILIDKNLFLDSMSVGPLFTITRDCGSDEPLERYGDACENVALQLLDSANRGQTAANRCVHLLHNPPGSDGELTDIMLGVSNVAALFEVKGVWLNDDLLKKSPHEFVDSVFQKYAAPLRIDQSGKKHRPKGMGQLAEVIKGLNDHSIVGLGEADFVNQITEIIPVLVVQDSLISEPMMSKRLVLEFSSLLGEQVSCTGKIQFGRLIVHNAIILNFFDLEVIESVELDCSILDLLKQYSERSPDRLLGFARFWNERRFGFQARQAESQLVRGTAIRRFDQIQRDLFGNRD